MTPSSDSYGSLRITGVNVLKTPVPCSFKPLPDITAYELASALPFFFGQPMFEEDFKSLGAAQRHWQRRDSKTP